VAPLFSIPPSAAFVALFSFFALFRRFLFSSFFVTGPHLFGVFGGMTTTFRPSAIGHRLAPRHDAALGLLH
jgi:hypothetical protein